MAGLDPAIHGASHTPAVGLRFVASSHGNATCPRVL